MQAQDVMTTWVATIEANATVRDAAKLMAERKVNALPVLDTEDSLVGSGGSWRSRRMGQMTIARRTADW